MQVSIHVPFAIHLIPAIYACTSTYTNNKSLTTKKQALTTNILQVAWDGANVLAYEDATQDICSAALSLLPQHIILFLVVFHQHTQRPDSLILDLYWCCPWQSLQSQLLASTFTDKKALHRPPTLSSALLVVRHRLPYQGTSQAKRKAGHDNWDWFP